MHYLKRRALFASPFQDVKKEVGVHSTPKGVGFDAVKSDETEKADIIYFGNHATAGRCTVRACTEDVGNGK